jgi:hypothetical protein
MASKGGAPRWSQEQLAAHLSKKKPHADEWPFPAPKPAQSGPGEAFYALGRMEKGKMNGTEAAYAQILEAEKHEGKIRGWKFHAIKIRLADRAWYEPDFIVQMASGEIQVREVKGSFTTEKGQLKIRMAAETMPWFRFIKCSRQKDGRWEYEEFNK